MSIKRTVCKLTDVVSYQAFDNSRFIGMIAHDGNIITVMRVDPQYRNKGYGRLLINYLCAQLSTKHYCIQVKSTETAAGFYEKYGFMRPTYFQRKYYDLDDTITHFKVLNSDNLAIFSIFPWFPSRHRRGFVF